MQALRKRIRANWKRYQQIRHMKSAAALKERRKLWERIRHLRRRVRRLSKNHNRLMWKHIGHKRMMQRIRNYMIRLRKRIGAMQRQLRRLEREGSKRAVLALRRRIRYLRFRFRQIWRYYKSKAKKKKRKPAVKEIKAAVARRVQLRKPPMPRNCGRKYFGLAKRIILAFNNKWGLRSKRFTKWIHRTRTRAQKLRATAAGFRGQLVSKVRARSKYLRR